MIRRLFMPYRHDIPTYVEVEQRKLQEVQRRASLLAWNVEPDAQGYFVSRGVKRGFIASTLEQASQRIEQEIASMERRGIPLVTQGKLYTPARGSNWRKTAKKILRIMLTPYPDEHEGM